MKVLNPGHLYALADSEKGEAPSQTLQFVEKVPARETNTVLKIKKRGTTNEEVLRVLIDRMNFLQDKMPCEANEEVIKLLTQCSDLLYKRTLNRQSRGVAGIHQK